MREDRPDPDRHLLAALVGFTVLKMVPVLWVIWWMLSHLRISWAP